jgi:hypothetical protein
LQDIVVRKIRRQSHFANNSEGSELRSPSGTHSPFGLVDGSGNYRVAASARLWSDHARLAILAASCLIAAVLLIVALVAPDYLDVLRRHGW